MSVNVVSFDEKTGHAEVLLVGSRTGMRKTIHCKADYDRVLRFEEDVESIFEHDIIECLLSQCYSWFIYKGVPYGDFGNVQGTRKFRNRTVCV